MSKELEALENLLSFAFVMSENMVGLTKGHYDEKIFVKKTYEYLNKYIGNFECRDILKSALQRLEEIDNSNPSEALKYLEELQDYLLRDGINISSTKNYNIIKQALIQAEHDKKLLKIYEQENENQFNNIVDKEKKALAFDIIKEKRVDVYFLMTCIEDNKLVDRYNQEIREQTMFYHNGEKQLTQEEFDLLKEVLG